MTKYLGGNKLIQCYTNYSTRIHVAGNPNLVLYTDDEDWIYTQGMQLGVFPLDGIERYERETLDTFHNYDPGPGYYDFSEYIPYIKDKLRNCDSLTLWSFPYVDEYMVPYWFIYEFYDDIVDKDVGIVKIEQKTPDTIAGDDFHECMKLRKKRSRRELFDYAKEFERIKSENMDLRYVKDGVIYSTTMDHFDDDIVEMIRQKPRIKKNKLLIQCLTEDTIPGADPFVYRYRIEQLIEKRVIYSDHTGVPDMFMTNDGVYVRD